MTSIKKKRVGIFLGRLQPQHEGHENLIRTIFTENDEVVLCLGSAQRTKKSDPDFARNPLSKSVRLKRLHTFVKACSFDKPYRTVTAVDIASDAAWPSFLKKCCRLRDDDLNTIYFSDRISPDYRSGLEEVGFKIRHTRRTKFTYRSERNTFHRLSSATEIRSLDKNIYD